jgi:hypothetical protein
MDFGQMLQAFANRAKWAKDRMVIHDGFVVLESRSKELWWHKVYSTKESAQAAIDRYTCGDPRVGTFEIVPGRMEIDWRSNGKTEAV